MSIEVINQRIEMPPGCQRVFVRVLGYSLAFVDEESRQKTLRLKNQVVQAVTGKDEKVEASMRFQDVVLEPKNYHITKDGTIPWHERCFWKFWIVILGFTWVKLLN